MRIEHGAGWVEHSVCNDTSCEGLLLLAEQAIKSAVFAAEVVKPQLRVDAPRLKAVFAPWDG